MRRLLHLLIDNLISLINFLSFPCFYVMNIQHKFGTEMNGLNFFIEPHLIHQHYYWNNVIFLMSLWSIAMSVVAVSTILPQKLPLNSHFRIQKLSSFLLKLRFKILLPTPKPICFFQPFISNSDFRLSLIRSSWSLLLCPGLCLPEELRFRFSHAQILLLIGGA